jgi:hypothetical protein
MTEPNEPGRHTPHEGEWFEDRSIYIHIGKVRKDGKWAMIDCYIIRSGDHPWDRTYMQHWEKEQLIGNGVSWRLLKEPPAEVIDGLTWSYDGNRDYYGPKPR